MKNNESVEVFVAALMAAGMADKLKKYLSAYPGKELELVLEIGKRIRQLANDATAEAAVSPSAVRKLFRSTYRRADVCGGGVYFGDWSKTLKEVWSFIGLLELRIESNGCASVAPALVEILVQVAKRVECDGVDEEEYPDLVDLCKEVAKRLRKCLDGGDLTEEQKDGIRFVLRKIAEAREFRNFCNLQGI